uniref:Facilitated trehalose transporter Tret1 n=1 Tax=Cacopsylla melanoneura TaxID=428564 RepID=A0A8D8LRB4_9HEMI
MFFPKMFSNHEVRQYLAAWSWNLGAMNMGFFLGWSGVTTPDLQSATSPIYESALTDEEVSYTTSFPFITALISSMVWGYIANSLGRKITGYLTALCFTTCYIIALTSDTFSVFVIGRMIGGLAYCAVLFNGPMYIAEMAEVQKLGRISATYLISENFGILTIYILGSYVSYDVLNVFCLAFSVLFLVLIMIFPESPVYYLKTDRPIEARVALQWFRPENEQYLESELKRLNDTFILSKKFKFKYLFTKHTLMALFIALNLQVGIQLTGMHYVACYTVDIFQRTASVIDPYTSTIITGIFLIIAPCCYFVITNHFGRKTITIVSFFLQSLTWAILGGYYFYIEHNTIEDSSPLNYLPLVCISLYCLFFAGGGGCIPFTIYGEIFSAEVRNAVMPFIYIWNALNSFAVLKLVPTIMLQTIHMSGVFWFFSIISFYIVLFTIFVIPETKGKPFLTVIDDLTKKACWK